MKGGQWAAMQLPTVANQELKHWPVSWLALSIHASVTDAVDVAAVMCSCAEVMLYLSSFAAVYSFIVLVASGERSAMTACWGRVHSDTLSSVLAFRQRHDLATLIAARVMHLHTK